MISCLDEIYLPLTSYLMIEGGRQAQWTEGWGWGGVGVVITNCMLYYHGQWTFFLPERKYIVMVNNVFYSEGCNCRIQANMRTKRLSNNPQENMRWSLWKDGFCMQVQGHAAD